jgi:hypothetical protein
MFGASTPFCLSAPPTPTLFGVFAFHHKQSPFNTGVCTPSIRCLYNSSSFHPCMHRKGLRLLSSSRAQETSCCTNFNNLCSELHLRILFLLVSVVSLQYLVGSYGYSCTISVCPHAISVLQISPYSLLMFDSSSSCHNICPSQNRVSIFIPLLYVSSIIRVFINSPLKKS